jgi:hypothetical protein
MVAGAAGCGRLNGVDASYFDDLWDSPAVGAWCRELNFKTCQSWAAIRRRTREQGAKEGASTPFDRPCPEPHALLHNLLVFFGQIHIQSKGVILLRAVFRNRQCDWLGGFP